MTIQERLRAQEDRAGQLRALADAATGREFDEAEQRNWDDLNTAYDAEKKALDSESRAADRDARLALLDGESQLWRGLPGGGMRSHPGGANDRSNAPDEKTINRALRGWAAGRKARTDDVAAARSLGIDLESNEVTLRINDRQFTNAADIRMESRGLQSGLTLGAGGALVIPQFAATFDEAMLDYDDMRAFSDVIRTEGGNPMSWPGGDDTANEGSWVAVDESADETDLSFVQQQWGAHTITSDAIRVDRGLLQDASYDLIGRISRSCGTRIGRGMARAHTTGTGVGQPTGIVTSAYLGKTAAATGAFTADEMMDLLASVGTAYARNGRIMCHRDIKWAMRKIKDGQSRYLWEPQLQSAGMPDNILGYPIVENSNMSNALTTGQKIILFGDLSAYKIRDVSSITLQRLVETYALKNQDAFVAFARTDGMLLASGQSAATKPVKYLALA